MRMDSTSSGKQLTLQLHSTGLGLMRQSKKRMCPIWHVKATRRCDRKFRWASRWALAGQSASIHGTCPPKRRQQI